MLFSTPEFIVFFLVILTTIVIIKNRKFQHLFLLSGSYFFFFYTSNYLILLLIISSLLDFYVGKKIWSSTTRTQKKIFLSISLIGNLALLGFFKYADFAILQFNIFGEKFNILNEIPLMNLALPIGISFYTFQTISYTVDIYRGKLEPTESFKEFALFVSFFPQLVAGPIVRATDFLPQLREKSKKIGLGKKIKQIRIQEKNLKLGITIMALGFFKKMFFADNIAVIANDVFISPIGASSLEIWLGTIAFGIQIYCDFSGYSDIAIGAAMILGFRLPMNFNKPYFASSFSDFWKRWHISLSSWLRDYLYIPLGGNRKSRDRTYVNLFTVMVFGGLWHGAGVNFIVWGILHGLYLAFHQILKKIFPNISQKIFFKTKFGKIISILITQYFIFLAWIPFRVHDMESMFYSMSKYILIDFQTSEVIQFALVHKTSLMILCLFCIFHFISFSKGDIANKISKYNLKVWFIFLTIISLTIIVFYSGNPENFIYFKF